MQFDQLKRREFITLLGGAATWSVAARAESDGARRVGVIMGFAENDEVWQTYLATFRQSLQDLGWTDRRNIHLGTPTNQVAGGSSLLLANRRYPTAWPHVAAGRLSRNSRPALPMLQSKAWRKIGAAGADECWVTAVSPERWAEFVGTPAE